MKSQFIDLPGAEKFRAIKERFILSFGKPWSSGDEEILEIYRLIPEDLPKTWKTDILFAEMGRRQTKVDQEVARLAQKTAALLRNLPSSKPPAYGDDDPFTNLDVNDMFPTGESR
jgi:hypothetical protein